jgi:hypothetical protein
MSQSYIFRGIQLPDHLKDSIDAYVREGRPVGNFLRSCIENNLLDAVARADPDNHTALIAVVGYLSNMCPERCWGSIEKYDLWLERKRIERNLAQMGAQTNPEQS